MTEYDIDCITAMMVVCLHAAERCVQDIELHYMAEQRKTKEYQQMVKLFGKAGAEQRLGKIVQEVFRHDKKWQLSELLRIGKQFHAQMEKLQGPAFISVKRNIPKDATAEERAAIEAENAQRTKEDMLRFDDLQRDISTMMYVAAAMYNITKEDETRVLSTLKLYANKGNTFSQELLDHFENRLRK